MLNNFGDGVHVLDSWLASNDSINVPQEKTIVGEAQELLQTRTVHSLEVEQLNEAQPNEDNNTLGSQPTVLFSRNL